MSEDKSTGKTSGASGQQRQGQQPGRREQDVIPAGRTERLTESKRPDR